MTKLKTIYLDCDGVLCDLVTPAMYAVARQDLLQPGAWPKGVYDFSTVLDMPAADFWQVIHAHGPEFWEQLPAYKWMWDLHRAAKHHAHQVTLLTTPTLHPSSTEGKHRWINRHFGWGYRQYVMTPVKHHLAAPGRILIDDCPANIDGWTAAGGTGILFPQPWNPGEGDITTVLNQLAALAT